MFIVPSFRALRGHLGFVAGLALMALSSAVVNAQSTPSAADGFDPNVDGTVFTVVTQADGKILIGGTFSYVSNVPHANIARLNINGGFDQAFNVNTNGKVTSIAVQPDGKILIGGYFSTVQSGATTLTRNCIARLNPDGSLDSTFDPNLSAVVGPGVEAILLQPDGKVVVGGTFTSAKPNGAATATTRNRMARFNSDGTLDTGFDPNVDRSVLSLALQTDGKIVLGGGFTMLQSNGAATPTTRNSLARVNADGSLDMTYDPDADNGVTKIVIQPDGKIVAGGYFANVTPNGATGPIARSHLARFDTAGNADLGFNPSVSGNVFALALQANGGLIVGGTFATVISSGRNFVARLNVDGSVDVNFNPNPNYTVYAAAEQVDGEIILAGNFTQLQANSAISPVSRNHIARVNPDGSLDADFSPDTNGRVLTLAVQADGKALVGGSFTSIAGVTRNYFARLNVDGSLDTSFNPNMNGQVTAIALQSDGRILVGGSFTTVNGIAHNHFARLSTDGTLDTAFDPSPDAQVNAIVVQSDGKILIGGNFVTLLPNGSAVASTLPHIARVNPDGSFDATFNPQATGNVYAIAIQADGKILVGGNFSGFATADRLNIVRFNPDGTVDPNYNPNANRPVYAIVVQADGKAVIGGDFTFLQPSNAPIITTTTTNSDGSTSTSQTQTTTRAGIARLNVDGTVDTTYDPNPNSAVRALILQSDGHIVAGGLFNSFEPNGSTTSVTHNYLARINTDGTVDPSFDLDIGGRLGNQVVTMAQQPSDGKILIGGSFTTLLASSASPVGRNQLARITATGTLDTSYAPSTGGPAGAVINTLALQADGRLLVGGGFSAFAGTSSSNLVRFNADSLPDISFNPNVDGPVNALAVRPKGGPIGTQLSGFAWLNADGSLRSSFSSAAQIGGQVNAMVVQPDGKIVLGGSITNLAGTTGNYLIRFNPDGSLDTSFNPGVDGIVNAVALQSDGSIVIGGNFLNVGGLSRQYVARVSSAGVVDPTFDPKADALVKAVAIQSDGSIILGGNFSSFFPNGATDAVTQVNFLARFKSDGTYDPSLNLNPNGTVYAIAIQTDGAILLGGAFSNIHASTTDVTLLTRNHIVRIKTNNSVDTTFDPNAGNLVLALAIQPDGKIVLGGTFNFLQANNSPTIITRNYIARVNSDGSLDEGFDPNPNNTVDAVTVQPDGKVVLGGVFTTLQADNAPTASLRNNLARVNSDGSLDTAFNPNPTGTIAALLAQPDGSVLVAGAFGTVETSGAVVVGGSFNNISGSALKNLALLNSDGSLSGGFAPNPNGAVYALAIRPDDHVIVVGTFTSIAGATRQGVAQVNLSGVIDSSFNANASVSGGPAAVLLQPDGKVLIGGVAVGFGGTTRGTLERLNADGSLDASFNPSGLGSVDALALQPDGKILVGGTSVGQLARLNADGSRDTSFSPNPNGAVNSIDVQSDGHIVVGGNFTSIAGSNVTYLARLNATGTIDSTFSPGVNGIVTTTVVSPTGKIFLGGSFTSVGSAVRYGIARLASTTPALQSISIGSNFTTVTWTRSGASPALVAASFEQSFDGRSWRALGDASRTGTSDTWQLSGLALPTDSPLFIRARGIEETSQYGSASVVEAIKQFYSGNVPLILSSTTANATTGSTFYYGVGTNVLGARFGATGLPPGLSIDPASGVISGTATQTGTYPVTLTVSNSAGTVTGTLLLVVSTPSGGASVVRFVNLSSRARVTATDPLIAGLVIGGTSTRTILLRAVGPGLAPFGVSTGIPHPMMRLYDGNGDVVSENAGWGGSAALSAVFNQVGAFALDPNSADAAMLVTLAPGRYSVVVTDTTGATGVALAEVYDTGTDASASAPRLVNISSRATANSGDTTLIGGFVISGPTSKRVLIRGVGPTLGSYGVTTPMADPVLNLYDGGNNLIAQNDNWETPVTITSAQPAASAADINTAIVQAGSFAFSSGSKDAAIIVTLAPGIYSAQVKSATSTDGTALVEIYELP